MYSTGVDLKTADTLILVEPPIVVSQYVQAIGRLRRLSQGHRSFKVYSLQHSESAIESSLYDNVLTEMRVIRESS